MAAVGNDKSLVAAPTKLFYQSRDVRRYNLAIPLTPAAVTYPKTAQQVAEIIKCATDQGLKVQARSGGHSYGNYGMPNPKKLSRVTDSCRTRRS